MKRAAVFFLAFILALSLASCGAADKSGEYMIIEGKIISKEAPTGTSSITLKLTGGFTVYTKQHALLFDAEDMTCTVPTWGALSEGDKIKVWADKQDDRGRYAANCVLINLDGGYEGSFVMVDSIELRGDEMIFTDTDGKMRVTAARGDISDPDALLSGASVFVWREADNNESEFTALYVRVVKAA